MYNNNSPKESIGRILAVIDCESKIIIKFQLSEYTIKPKDANLPDYKQVTKITEFRNSDLVKQVLDACGVDNPLDIIPGTMVKLTLEPKLTRQSTWYPAVLSVQTTEGVSDEFDWGIESFKFILTQDTTIEDVKKLGFDGADVKETVFYKNLLKQQAAKNEVNPTDLF